MLCAAICGIAEGASSALTGGSFWEGFENGAFFGAIAAIILSGIAFVFTGIIAGVSLVLDQILLSGALLVSGGGLSLIAELGGIFNNITDISWEQMLQSMAFSAAFAEVFYNLSKAVGTADKATEGISGAKKKEKTKSVEDVLEDAEPGKKTKGKTKQWEKEGGYDKALQDFDDLGVEDVQDMETGYGTGKRGKLTDGRDINVRPGSSAEAPPLEIINPNGTRIKIRYK